MSGKYLAAFFIFLAHTPNPDPSPTHGGDQLKNGKRYLRPGGAIFGTYAQIMSNTVIAFLLTQNYDN